MTKLKIKKTKFYQTTTIALAIVLMVVLVFGVKNCTGAAIFSTPNLGTETVEYLNTNYGTEATLVNSENVGGVYKLVLNIEGQDTEVYVSPDGSLIFPLAIDKNMPIDTTEPTATTTPTEVPKTEKPYVQLFIMSHCPYGTQIEKGILPVVETLGDKIDFDVKFVYYAMHDSVELNEQLNQYCIQKEFKSQYTDYLSCFLEEGNTEACVTEMGFDQTKLDACISATDEEFKVTEMYNDKSTWAGGSFPLFNVHNEENQKYGVQGSPTLVINEVPVQTGRDSASLLGAICAGFENAPEECNTELSATSPAPGFGYEGTGAATAATCG